MQFVGVGVSPFMILPPLLGIALYVMYLWSLIKLFRKTGTRIELAPCALFLDLCLRGIPSWGLLLYPPIPPTSLVVVFYLAFHRWPREIAANPPRVK